MGFEGGAVGGRLVRTLDLLVAFFACSAAAVMTVVVSAEVVARYVFNDSIPFSNELSRILFVWTIFLGLPLALGRGRHVAIGLLDQLLPPAGARIAFRAGCLASISLLSVVLYKSVELTSRNWDQTLNTIGFSAGVYYLPIPIGVAVAIVYLAIMVWSGRRQLISDDDHDTLGAGKAGPSAPA